MKDENDLEFKVRKVKNIDDEYENVIDLFINDIIYRPVELEHLSCYEIIAYYQMKKLQKKKIESGNLNVEAEKVFNLVNEHPSYKYMVMSQLEQTCVPCISSINLLPNVADLAIDEEQSDNNVLELREKYALIILLLFYPFRTQSDLELNGSYWRRYRYAINNKKISDKCLEVIQNIQDVCYNCSKLKSARDDLEQETVYVPHEDDEKRKTNVEELNTVSIEKMNELFQHADNFGIREVNPSERKLSLIGNRHDIVNQNLPTSDIQNIDITDTPDNIIIPGQEKGKGRNIIESDEKLDDKNPLVNNSSNMNYALVIDILNDTVLKNLPLRSSYGKYQQKDMNTSKELLSLQSVISHYKLRF